MSWSRTACSRTATEGRDEYDVIGPVDYTYIDLADVREDFHKRREAYPTETDKVSQAYARNPQFLDTASEGLEDLCGKPPS